MQEVSTNLLLFLGTDAKSYTILLAVLLAARCSTPVCIWHHMLYGTNVVFRLGGSQTTFNPLAALQSIQVSMRAGMSHYEHLNCEDGVIISFSLEKNIPRFF